MSSTIPRRALHTPRFRTEGRRLHQSMVTSCGGKSSVARRRVTLRIRRSAAWLLKVPRPTARTQRRRRQLMGKKRQRSSVEPLSAASTVTATTTRTPGSRTARPLVPAAMPRRMPPARPRRKLLQWLLRWPMARPRRLRRRLVSWRRLALRASGESAAGSAPRCWSARGCAARAILPTGETARMRPGEFSCGLHPLARLRPPCWLHGGPVCGNA
mmetsp:Transcript_28000/g.80333  ORF Transcript_28000/g.80333 Transcript_28000/m.80333 type:complete len:214 (+) Transcript_28000:2381-3022(+)